MANLMWMNVPGTRAVRRLLGAMFLASICAAPTIVMAATGPQTVQRVRKEVAANPSKGPTILKNRLEDLSETERTKYAASALAAALEISASDYKGDHKEHPCDHIMRLYRAALTAAPRAAVSLLEVAYRACPEYLAAFRDAALQAARAAGLSDVAAAIIAQADALAAGNTRATVLLGPLGGTINPANVGGPKGFEKEKDVSPSE